jgi:hypothetical protein
MKLALRSTAAMRTCVLFPWIRIIFVSSLNFSMFGRFYRFVMASIHAQPRCFHFQAPLLTTTSKYNYTHSSTLLIISISAKASPCAQILSHCPEGTPF